MGALPLYLATLSGLILALLFGASPIGVFLFVCFAGLGHVLADLMPARSERVYWYGLGALLLFIVVNMLGLGLHRFLMIAPVIFMIGHFVSRVTSRIMHRAV